jgi:hypothetical protein
MFIFCLAAINALNASALIAGRNHNFPILDVQGFLFVIAGIDGK